MKSLVASVLVINKATRLPVIGAQVSISAAPDAKSSPITFLTNRSGTAELRSLELAAGNPVNLSVDASGYFTEQLSIPADGLQHSVELEPQCLLTGQIDYAANSAYYLGGAWAVYAYIWSRDAHLPITTSGIFSSPELLDQLRKEHKAFLASPDWENGTRTSSVRNSGGYYAIGSISGRTFRIQHLHLGDRVTLAISLADSDPVCSLAEISAITTDVGYLFAPGVSIAQVIVTDPQGQPFPPDISFSISALNVRSTQPSDRISYLEHSLHLVFDPDSRMTYGSFLAQWGEEYMLLASPGVLTGQTHFTVPAGDKLVTATVSVIGSERSSSMHLRVRTRDDNPVNGATIELHTSTGVVVSRFKTDQNGDARIQLSSEVATMSVSCPGWATVSLQPNEIPNPILLDRAPNHEIGPITSPSGSILSGPADLWTTFRGGRTIRETIELVAPTTSMREPNDDVIGLSISQDTAPAVIFDRSSGWKTGAINLDRDVQATLFFRGVSLTPEMMLQRNLMGSLTIRQAIPGIASSWCERSIPFQAAPGRISLHLWLPLSSVRIVWPRYGKLAPVDLGEPRILDDTPNAVQLEVEFPY
jgi:hypothetical protein